jgi:hypothetical protein
MLALHHLLPAGNAGGLAYLSCNGYTSCNPITSFRRFTESVLDAFSSDRDKLVTP